MNNNIVQGGCTQPTGGPSATSRGSSFGSFGAIAGAVGGLAQAAMNGNLAAAAKYMVIETAKKELQKAATQLLTDLVPTQPAAKPPLPPRPSKGKVAPGGSAAAAAGAAILKELALQNPPSTAASSNNNGTSSGKGQPSAATHPPANSPAASKQTPPQPWREQLAKAVQDEEAGVCWKNPDAMVWDDKKLSTEEHLGRNRFNYCPNTLPPDGVSDGVSWDEKAAAFYHGGLNCTEGKPVDGSIGNNSFECCYDDKNEVVPNADRSGTYNFGSDNGICVAGYPVPSSSEHARYDVCPHEEDSNYDHANMTLNAKPVSEQLSDSVTEAASEQIQNIRNSASEAVESLKSQVQQFLR